MKKSETEKKPFGTGKVIGLSLIAVLLTVILTALLLGCMAARHFVYRGDGTAVGKIPLDQVTFSDGSTPAREIKNRYITDNSISEGAVQHILRDGKFSTQLGELFGDYCKFLTGEGAFPEVTEETFRTALRENDDTIRLHTGIHAFSENYPAIYAAVQPDLDAWNAKVLGILETGKYANLLRTVISQWIWILLGVLLLLVLIWLTVIHVRGQKRVATAFKTFAAAAAIPSLALLLTGLLGTGFLRNGEHAVYAQAFDQISATPKLIGGLACLACAAIFGIGILANAISGKSSDTSRETASAAPANEPEPAITEPAAAITEPEPAITEPAAAITEPAAAITEPEPVIIRKYCRFCGGELVNNDAKFCYKCGKPQEPME